MKKFGYMTLIALILLTVFSSCEKEKKFEAELYQTPVEITLDGKWSLIRIYGGISGANETHPSGEVEWIFNNQNHTLTVYNTGNTSTYFDLPTGSYNYQQITISNQHYLVIQGEELGQLTISGNQLLIDENKKSAGEGACGFYMILEH